MGSALSLEHVPPALGMMLKKDTTLVQRCAPHNEVDAHENIEPQSIFFPPISSPAAQIN